MYWKEVSIVLLIFLLASGIVHWQTYTKTMSTTEQEILQKSQQLEHVQQQLSELRKQVEHPRIVEKIVEKEVLPEIKTRKMYVLAFDRKTQEGVVGSVIVSLIPGKGDILIDVRPFNSPAVQHSAESAVTAALKEANIPILRDKDIKIQFAIEGGAVGGESAGIAISLATLALLTDTKIKPYVAATGTITSEGIIGKVGGILQKAEAISKKNVKLMLIPRGTAEVTVITPHYYIDPITKKRVSKGEPVQRTINAIKEARSRWNLELQQVETLAEAKKYVFE